MSCSGKHGTAPMFGQHTAPQAGALKKVTLQAVSVDIRPVCTEEDEKLSQEPACDGIDEG